MVAAGGSSAAPRSYSVLQVSDLHLLEDPSKRLLGVDTAETFEAVVAAALHSHGPFDAVIVTGDIAHEPSVATYERAREILWRYHRGGAALWLPGNHDVMHAMARVFPTDDELVLGSWHVIAIDTHVDETEQGSIAARELRRVTNRLAAVEGKSVVIAGHHPCVSVGTPWLDRGCIANGEDLLHLLESDSRIAAYVFGHIHHAAEIDGARCPMLAAPSTCFQFAQGGTRFGVTDAAPGCRVLRLKDSGEFESTVIRAPYELKVDLTKFH